MPPPPPHAATVRGNARTRRARLEKRRRDLACMILDRFGVRVRRTAGQINQFVPPGKERCIRSLPIAVPRAAISAMTRSPKDHDGRAAARFVTATSQLHEAPQFICAHMKSVCTSGNPLAYIVSHCCSHPIFPMQVLRQSMSGKHSALAKHASS